MALNPYGVEAILRDRGMKSLQDWLIHLESLHPQGQAGIELGLERVARVKAVLAQKQHCPLIIVGGTNGKGSTCAYLEAIYRAAGYRTGCYTSPHLLRYNERVRIGGAMVADADLCAAFSRVEAARREAGDVMLTYFEFGTLAAWEVFTARQVDVAILEVGLGGRLDAVNVYDPDCAIVTGIALDHTDWLGKTREAIGFEKAGIFRAGKPAICTDPEPPQSLCSHAMALGADLRVLNREFSIRRGDTDWTFVSRDAAVERLPLPSLRGFFQLRNASAALAAVQCLQVSLPVSREAIAQGISNAHLRGRFECVREEPAVILDVAHNPQGIGELAINLDEIPVAGKTLAVVGMLADKAIADALAALAGKVDVWLLASLSETSRGASARVVRDAVAGLGGRIELFLTPEAAFAYAIQLAGEDDRIIVCGSFYTVAAVMRALPDVPDPLECVFPDTDDSVKFSHR